MGLPARRLDEWPDDAPLFRVYAEEEEEEEEEEEAAVGLRERVQATQSQSSRPLAPSGGFVVVQWHDAMLDAANLGGLLKDLDALANSLAYDEVLRSNSSAARPIAQRVRRRRLVRLDLVTLNTGSLEAVLQVLPEGWTLATLGWSLGLGFASSLAASMVWAGIAAGARRIRGDEPALPAPDSAKIAQRVAKRFKAGGGGRVTIRSIEKDVKGYRERTWSIRFEGEAHLNRTSKK